jgi:DNA primase
MGKISPVSGKYIVHAKIEIDGVVEKPDVIGAVFGQTEGLLGADLELRELQRSGRIGRIEVNTTSKGGKVSGHITIPSSMDKAETAIIGAALEVIERIGPCDAHIRVERIEDVRVNKRSQVIARAKELLRTIVDETIPDSLELAEEVSESVRVAEITSYGKDKLPAGPTIKDSEEVILVEGRADVITLLKYGFKNVIGMNGSGVPQTIIDLSKEKTMLVFVDGDRGGELNVRELMEVAELDLVARAPDGKEVEELTQKEIHKALRGKATPEQFLADLANSKNGNRNNDRRPVRSNDRNDRPVRSNDRNDRPVRNNDRPVRSNDRNDRNTRSNDRPVRNNDRNDRNARSSERTERAPRAEAKSRDMTDAEHETFSSTMDDLLGSKGAALLDEGSNILGKVPLSELPTTLKSLQGSVHAIVVDGDITEDMAQSCDDAKVSFAVGMSVSAKKAKTTLISSDKL